MKLKKRYPSGSLKNNYSSKLHSTKKKLKSKDKSLQINEQTLIDETQKENEGEKDTLLLSLISNDNKRDSDAEVNSKEEIILPALTKQSEYRVGSEPLYDDNDKITDDTKEDQDTFVDLEGYAINLANLVVKKSLSDVRINSLDQKIVSVSDAAGNVVLPVIKSESSFDRVSPPHVPLVTGYKPKIVKKSTLKREQPTVSKSLPLKGLDMLKYGPVEWEELSTRNPTQHHNAWLRHKVPSNPPSPRSSITVHTGLFFIIL